MRASKAWSSAAACVVVAVGLAAMVSSSEAYVFYAGGRDGWVLGPTESYNHWAGRNRFQVNDTIVFTHEEGVTSVLLVTEQDFDACSTRSPVRRLEAAAAAAAGRSVFKFDRSGPFFFISSDEGQCQKGQKLYIIVMAPRPPVALAPAPGSPQWTVFPPAGGTAPPPMWASAPEYARGPGMGAMGGSGRDGTSLSSSLGAPPPTAGASRSVGDAIVGSVVGVVGALLLCML